MNDDAPRIGLVDGSADSDSRRFFLVLEPDALVQPDELVAVTTPLAGGKKVTHYGIVTEITSRLEGTEFPSDTARFADRTLPAEHVRRAEVRVLRVVPEVFVSPHAGTPAVRAGDDDRKLGEPVEQPLQLAGRRAGAGQRPGGRAGCCATGRPWDPR